MAEGQRIDIGGIRFSGELIHYRHRRSSPDDRSLADILRGIAERRINMPFFCSGDDGESVHSSFCVTAADGLQIDQMLQAMGEGRSGEGTLLISEQVAKIEQVGTLTLFPHRHSLSMLGRVTASLAGAGIVIHSLCTSISALSVNIDYGLLDRAAALLQSVVVLPDHHAPFRADFTIRQIKR